MSVETFGHRPSDPRSAAAQGLPAGFDPLALMDGAPVLIAVHEGPEHRIAYVNAACERASAGRRLVGLTLGEALPGPLARRLSDHFDRALRTGEVQHAGVHRAAFGPGAAEPPRWCRHTLKPWFGADGTIRGVVSFAEDVTAEIEATEMVERRTAELGFALEVGGGVGTWDWDVVSDTLKVNDRFAAFFGVPLDGAQGLPIARFVAAILPEDRARVEAAIAASVAEGSDYLEDYRVHTIDGEVRWLTARGRCFHDAEGTPVRFPGVVIDITRQVEERQELERTYTLLKSFLDNSATYVFAKDLEGRYILANRFYLEAFGETEATLYGRTDRERFGEEETFSVNDRRVVESGEPIEFEESAVGADGETIHAISVKFPLRDPAGTLFGTGSVSTDVTARRNTEAALARSEERRQRAMAAGSVGTFEYYPADERFVWDGLTASILGFGSGGAVPLREIAKLVHREDFATWQKRIARATEARENRLKLEFRVIRPEDGAIRWIETVAEANPAGEQGTVMVGTVRDVTERKAYEEQLVYLNRELNHRVKNLFAVTRGMIRMAARQEPAAGEFAQRTIERLDALAAAHTIGMDANGIEPVDLRDMLTAILRPFADQHRTGIALDGPPLEIPRRMVTPLTLTVYELATNAFKHGCLARSEGTLSVRWEKAAEEPAATPALSICWTENCGGPVAPPPGSGESGGFGRRLIDALVVQMSGQQTISWEERGLHMRLDLPLEVST